MRTVHFCILLSGLTGAACGVYSIDTPERPTGEGNSSTPPTGGVGGTSPGSSIDDSGSRTGAGGSAGANGNGGASGAGNSTGTGAGGNGGSGPGTGGSTSGGGGASATTGVGGSSTGGSGGAGAGGNGGSGNGRDAAIDTVVGTGGGPKTDGSVSIDAGAGGNDGGAPRDALAEKGGTGTDAAGTGAWLRTSGNHIYQGSTVFHGRGANFHDTRSCNACAYSAPNVTEVNRRADELIDNWKATFIRLDLESSATADSRVQWQGVLDDPTYQADIVTMVNHATSKGAYVLLSLWNEPTTTANELPTDATFSVWRKLADMFKNEPRVLYGITNEPHNDTDDTVWAAMNSAVAAIRDVEAQAGTPQHIIAVQGTQQWARILTYYTTHPITAGGGTNIVYETHVYDPASSFASLFETPGQTIPVIIGEFGEQDADELMQRAEAAQIPYLAWTFHGRCPPNLIVDNSGGGCGVGMDLVPTDFGQKLKTRLATPW